jgi:hypothetical protein
MGRRKSDRRQADGTTRGPQRLIAAATALILVIGAGASVSWPRWSQPVDAGGRVAVTPSMVDLHSVKLNTPAEALFRVTNTGTGPLQILGNPKVEAITGC